MYYCRQTTETCKGIRYPSKTHPYKYGKSGCIYTSGCGVCSTLMVLKNFKKVHYDTKSWTAKCLQIGARGSEGTNLDTVASYMNSIYGIAHKKTSSIKALKEHLLKGGRAVICVSGGGKRLLSTGGHYVYVAGITSTNKLIILDPYWYDGKFTATANRRKYTKVVNSREVIVSAEALRSDISMIWLFSVKDKSHTQYSTNDANKDPQYAKGSFTLKASRGVYQGPGSEYPRKKVKQLTSDGQAHVTNTKPSADAYLKKGTKVSLSQFTKSVSGNWWARCPSGWICVWMRSGRKEYI